MVFLKKISSQEPVDFAKSLSIMIKSGIPITEALASLAEQTKSKEFSKIIYRVKREIETGTSLSQAFAKEKKVFGRVFIGFIKAGEASGTLEESLSFLASWLEHTNDLKNEVNAAVFYPKIVLMIAGILGGGVSLFILPQLVPLFGQLQVELPPTTRILLAVTIFIQKFWPPILLAIVGVIVGFIQLSRIKAVRRFLHLIYLRIPIIGNLMRDYQLALISQLFSSLFKTGLPISETLDFVSEAAANVRYQESIKKIKERVDGGTTLSESMKDYPSLYPKNVVGIVAVGEASGTIETSFGYLTEFYTKEVMNKTKRLPTAIEPLLLVSVGVVIGFVALAIIDPIYRLTAGFGQ